MDNSDRLGLSLLNGHPGILFLNASYTDEKPYHFSIVANDISNKHNIPLAVDALRRYILHLSPVENGIGSKGNASIKHAASELARHELRDPKTPMHKAMRETMRANGIAYNKDNQDNVVIFSEDSVIGVPKEIWPYFRELLTPHVNLPLLDNIQPYMRWNPVTEKDEEADFEGDKYAMLVDFGQMKDALPGGTYEFYDLLRQAAQQWAKDNNKPLNHPIKMIDEVSVYWSRLSDSEGSPKRLRVRSTDRMRLYAPNGLDQQLEKPTSIFVPPKDGIINRWATFAVPRHFLCTPDKPDEPISDRYFDHVRDESFRRLVFEKLLTQMTPVATPALDFKKAQYNITARRPKNPFVVQVTPGQKPAPHKGIVTAQYIPQNFQETAKLLAMEFPGGVKGRPRTADVLVVPPHTPTNFEERIRFLTLITSIMVARQIDPRYSRPASMIVLNQNGCHDWWMKLSNRLTDAGFNGNYFRDLRYERGGKGSIIDVPGVSLNSDRYFHFLNGADEGGLYKAYNQLLDHCLQNFTRSPHHPGFDSFGETNRVKPADMFSVVGFMTANNEGRSQARIAHDFGAAAALNNSALGWGGMNKRPGLDLEQAYKNNRGPYLFASSTNDLARTETSKGELSSGLDAWILRSQIAARAGDLYTFGDAFFSLYGGVGTVQEDGLVLLGEKPLIFVDEILKDVTSEPWKHSIKGLEMAALLGEEMATRLVCAHDVYADKNIFLATSIGEANDYLRMLEKTKASRPAAKSLGGTLFSAPAA
ncbi:MAG: hypothetical protein WCD70_03150 [Alphaproteobacteria bacterium]